VIYKLNVYQAATLLKLKPTAVYDRVRRFYRNVKKCEKERADNGF
jgi:hypothetical protein